MLEVELSGRILAEDLNEEIALYGESDCWNSEGRRMLGLQSMKSVASTGSVRRLLFGSVAKIRSVVLFQSCSVRRDIKEKEDIKG